VIEIGDGRRREGKEIMKGVAIADARRSWELKRQKGGRHTIDDHTEGRREQKREIKEY
jgi:hypothetical protein